MKAVCALPLERTPDTVRPAVLCALVLAGAVGREGELPSREVHTFRTVVNADGPVARNTARWEAIEALLAE